MWREAACRSVDPRHGCREAIGQLQSTHGMPRRSSVLYGASGIDEQEARAAANSRFVGVAKFARASHGRVTLRLHVCTKGSPVSDVARPLVAVAMSGGVDSAVAASLLARDGYRIVGMTLRLWSEEHGPEATRENRCCSLESVNDARRVCEELGAPHYVVNVERQFKRAIVDHFVESYLAGKTPNPCVRCNQFIKFGALWQHAKLLGATMLATGHYARVDRDPESGEAFLLRAADR